MSVYQIIGGVLLLLACILIIISCLMQDQKQQSNMTGAITGASSDSYYGKNEGRSKEATLNKFTRNLAIIFFIVTLAINIVPNFVK